MPNRRSCCGDVRLGWALVDEHGALWHLDQRRVALADVEERDPEPRRWWDDGLGGGPPRDRDQRDAGGHGDTVRDRRAEDDCATSPTPTASTASAESCA